MQSRLAVIMVADVVGYSAMMAADEAVAIAAVKDINDNFLAPNAAENSGEIIKRMGDGWIVTFGSVPAAVRCAVATQDGLAAQPKVKLRIGAHIGEITEDEDDFYGTGVNIAARLQNEAPPGGVMVSQDLQRQLTGELGASFTDAGSFNLKNIPYPINGFQWRPVKKVATGDDLPTIIVEDFQFAPADDDTGFAAQELRDQLIVSLTKRSGIKLLNGRDDARKAPSYALKGRLRIANDVGRLNLTLAGSDDKTAVFSRNYEGDTADIFHFLDDLVGQATADLRFHTSVHDADRLDHLADDELSVSELRARAAKCIMSASIEKWEKANELLERAVALNPDDPIALVMRSARVWLAAAKYETLPAETVASLENDLNMAVAALPHTDIVFSARADFLTLAKRDPAAALRDAQRSLVINPNFPIGFQSLASAHMLAGKFDDAIAALERGIELGRDEPFVPVRCYFVAVCQYCEKRYDLAIAQLDRAIQLRHNIWAYHTLKAICHSAAGDEPAAKQAETVASKLPRVASIQALKPPLPDAFSDLIAQLTPENPNR